MKTVKVTEVLGSHSLDGRAFGPFQASKERPYLEVPEALASALNLPRYEDGTDAPPASTDAPQGAQDGVITDAQASETLRADLAEVTRERDELKLAIVTERKATSVKQQEADGWHFKFEQLQQENANNVRSMNAIGVENTSLFDLLRRLVAALPEHVGLQPAVDMGLAGLSQAVEAALPTLAERLATPIAAVVDPGGTPLVDGLPAPDLLTAHGFTTMEALEVGLVIPAGADESPVQAVNGIGKKSVEAYQKAVADWRAGLAQAAG